ncbi:hypothetical protein [Lacinutrix jangbogonensis]|uniref:hypothetical protein n=1 Tax=Lacinutrix jangbogonensis TaxID=1469557 RepID=UPI00053D7CE8|nr:hypothetical protein [Lacinutrix jangbogonensis]
MTHTFYVHINATTLSHYYVSGIIRPVGDIKNREKDFQNNCPQKVILSHKKWNNQSDCSIEIEVPDNEYKDLEQVSKDFVLSHSAFPISRIHKIYFTDKERAETIIWNINSGAGFVPSWSIAYENKKESLDIAEEYPYTHVSRIDNSKDLNVKLKRFDKLLGGFAFMKAAKVNDFTLDYTKNYLSTFSYFNTRISNDLKKNSLAINKSLHNIFTGKSEIFSYLAKDINQDIISEVALRENQVIENKFGTINLNRLNKDSLSFRLAILGTYGPQKSKKVDDLISGLLKNLEEIKREEIALIYGLYSGYTGLYNSFKIDNQKVEIKFSLESKMDFYIIESLFQYAFRNKVISNDFDYLSLNALSHKSTNQGYKYAKLLGGLYAYEKIDYTSNKKSIVEYLRKGISKLFGNSIYDINESLLNEKIETLLNPKLDELIKTVSDDNKERSIVSSKEKPKVIIDEPKTPSIKSVAKTIMNKPEVRKTTSIKPQESDATLDMFQEKKSKQEESTLFSYKQLNNKTVAVLKIEILNLGLVLPSNIKKKDDIIKFILSKQD